MLVSQCRKVIEAHTTVGVARATRNLWLELKLQLVHRAAVVKVKRMSFKDQKLNLGCGNNIKAGWINVDIFGNADLQLDLREPLPLPDGMVSFIYSEHFFEHLDYPDDALRFLNECRRVLQPGGTLSIGVPDCEFPLMSYANGDEEWFRVSRERWHPSWCNTRMHQINFLFRQMGDHKYAYDFDTLSKILKEAGFLSVDKRDFDSSLDSQDRKWGTLYVNAHK